ncbi:MAG: hypothetical protein KY444_10830 [Gemmatimonadetes bacterium]|nr:hypothetical protein [Gemmatimonadota bacterium]
MTYGPCAATLPAGFAEDAPGSGYYPARNRSGFAAVDAPDTAGGGVALPDAAQSVLNGFQTVVPGYRQTRLERNGDTLRVEFTGTVDGRPGRGTAHFMRFGTTVCGVTLFLLEGSDIAFDPTLRALTESVRAGDPAAPPPPSPARPTPAAPRR